MTRRSINPSDVFDSTRYGFSQAVATEGGTLVHVSGQVGWDAKEQLVSADLAGQTERALDNLDKVLRAAGGGLLDVVSLRIYVVESAGGDVAPIGRALTARFNTERQPAATWLVVSGLAADGLLIEIEAVAVIGAT